MKKVTVLAIKSIVHCCLVMADLIGNSDIKARVLGFVTDLKNDTEKEAGNVEW